MPWTTDIAHMEKAVKIFMLGESGMIWKEATG
jgi:hypothetical protein